MGAETTLNAAALLDPSQDGYHDTHPATTDDPAPMCHLPGTNRDCPMDIDAVSSLPRRPA